MAKRKQPWHADAVETVRALRSGGVALHSTDTVWGLAADSMDSAAVSKIFELKGRDPNDSLLMLIDSERLLEQLLPQLPDAAWELLEVSDRPITLVGQLSKQSPFEFAPGMVRSNGSIAVRLVQDPYLQFLIQGLGRPMASTSANITGQPAAVKWDDVHPQLKNQVDYCAQYKGSVAQVGRPSMLVRFDEHGRIEILRS